MALCGLLGLFVLCVLARSFVGGRLRHRCRCSLRTLSSMPLDIPLVGTGTVVRSNRQYANLPATIATFLALGGRLIDTAPAYGGVQAKLAQPLARVPRRELFLVSKVSIQGMGYVETLRTVNQTLRQLRTAYVDLFLVHRANNAPGKKGDREARVTSRLRLETYRALLTAQKAGLVRHVGVSNYGILYLNELAEAGLPRPAANELEFHPFIDARQWALVRSCQSRGIHVIAYNSLGGAGGALSSVFDGTAGAPPRAIASAHGMSLSQVLLRWAIEHGATVVPWASQREHIAENLGVTNFSLSPTELRAISRVPRPAMWADFSFNSPHTVDVHNGALACDSAGTLLRRHVSALDTLRARYANGEAAAGPDGIRTLVLDANEWPAAGLCEDEGDERRAGRRRGHAYNTSTGHLLGAFLERSRRPFVVLPRYLNVSSHYKAEAVKELHELLLAQSQALYPPGCAASLRSCRKGTHGCHRVPDGSVAQSGHVRLDGWAPACGDVRCHWCEGFSSFCDAMMTDHLLGRLVHSFYRRVSGGNAKQRTQPSTPSREAFSAAMVPASSPVAIMVSANVIRGAGSNSGGGKSTAARSSLNSS